MARLFSQEQTRLNLNHPLKVAALAGVTFSDSDSAPVQKCLNPGPDPGPKFLKTWESCSGSDSANHRPRFSSVCAYDVYKDHEDFCYCRNLKLTPDAGPKETQNLVGIDSSTPDPWPPLPPASTKLVLSANSLKGRSYEASSSSKTPDFFMKKWHCRPHSQLLLSNIRHCIARGRHKNRVPS